MPISISYKVSESVKPEKDQQQFYPFPQSNSKYRIELNKIKTKGGKVFVFSRSILQGKIFNLPGYISVKYLKFPISDFKKVAWLLLWYIQGISGQG